MCIMGGSCRSGEFSGDGIMSKLDWCLKQKNGIELIEPNTIIARSYIKDADDSLIAMERNIGKWRIVTAYYSCYNAFYALLMRSGIKCEIHDCTLELMGLFEFSEQERLFVKHLKELRIGVQYYLRSPSEIELVSVKRFVVHCKELMLKLDEDKIYKLREVLSQK